MMKIMRLKAWKWKSSPSEKISFVEDAPPSFALPYARAFGGKLELTGG